MTVSNEIQGDRIRKYLGHLTSQARSSLLVEIERMQMYDEDISGFEIILAELRAEFRKSGEKQNRIGNPSRYFFKPIEALFVDRSPERANSGQISRGSLSAIWEWINHGLLPSMARDYCEQMKQVIVRDNQDEAKLIVAGFQSKVIKTIEGYLTSERGIADVRTGLGKYTGSRASFDDLMKILLALRLRDAIVAFNDALPPKVDNFDDDALSRIRGLLDGFVAKHPEAMPFALTMVTKRLKVPWQLARLATKAARSKNAAEIAATRYAISIPMVLDHLDDQRIHLNHALEEQPDPGCQGHSHRHLRYRTLAADLDRSYRPDRLGTKARRGDGGGCGRSENRAAIPSRKYSPRPRFDNAASSSRRTRGTGIPGTEGPQPVRAGAEVN